MKKSGSRLDPTQKPLPLPERIGRYRIRSILGKGGFGLVYLGEDEHLDRKVAIKVPHPHLVADSTGAGAYLAEARTVAALEHPHIIPVYDVGSTESHPCFVVSKYIDGTDLAQRLARGRLSVGETVAMIVTVAEALHFAHKRGFVHRDIKPGNILLDLYGCPFVGDFGLALREQDIGKGPRYAGTPTYMSPEQARGEGHRVDGRSDVFSLGVVLYQMLSGRLPFLADSQLELMEVISRQEPKPLRQWDDHIDRELERISAKALAKRVSDRYDTAADFAEELRAYLQNASSFAVARVGSVPVTPQVLGTTPAVLTPVDRQPTPTPKAVMHPPTPTPSSVPLPIVPKGLRSFDQDDADFFLELLPGARDREGLPDSLRFWKKRIEETDPEKTFAVGLIYGPSGCGKSSLVKAGLLPRLARRVESLFVEATSEDTEHRLRRLLRKQFPDLSSKLDLKGLLAVIRQGQGPPPAHKLLVVFDQFEQWLFSQRGRDTSELVDALRQCDGSRVQVLVLVRDDFWLAVSRFLRELEVKLVEGQNSALVDLFPLAHAKKVLTAFGRANGDLPERIGELSPEQKRFVNEAVAGLAQEEKVISIRLALFSQMMKGRPWTVETLSQVGGAEGLGAAFLEETFAARSAPAEHRIHQKSVRAILKALMPPAGTDIKGHMRSRDELLAASGYGRNPKEFEDLLELLDRRLRLITPTDPGGDLGESSSQRVNFDRAKENPDCPPNFTSKSFYQLTHDYLVPSIRDWLRRKQNETPKGRAELLLEERAALWEYKKQTRHLPSLPEYLRIAWYTKPNERTPAQKEMVKGAMWLHGLRTSLLLGLLVSLFLIGWESYGRLESRRLRDRLLESTTADLPGIVKELDLYRRWINPLLQAAYAQAETGMDSRKKLRASLGLMPSDPTQVDYLFEQLLQAEPEDFVVIRGELSLHKSGLSPKLWSILEDSKAPSDQRFHAACALASYAPQDPRWEKFSNEVAGMLLLQKPFELGAWTDALQGASASLLPPLAQGMVEENGGLGERGLIGTIYGKLARGQADAFARLEKPLEEKCPEDAPEETKIALAKKQASLGLGLMISGKGEKVWALFRHGPDPTVRSFLVDRMGPWGVEAKTVLARLDGERDVSIRRAILWSLGEYGPSRLSFAERQNRIGMLLDWYRDDPDPGIHGATEWLLSQWNAQDALKLIAKSLATGKAEGKRQWYLNHEGHTMVIIPATDLFTMGDESVGKKRAQIRHNFSIASKEVTVEQFLRFKKDQKYEEIFAPKKDCPINNVNWLDTAAYCNWLSEKEGIPRDQWCYLPNKDGKYNEGMELAPNFLQRTGYRLPTEAEWEFACRAGATTSYFFGDSVEQLEKYGWFVRNSFGKSHSVAKWKSNDFGLFDMHGNNWEWCIDQFLDYGEQQEDRKVINNKGEAEKVDPKIGRVIRGGSFTVISTGAKSANRLSIEPVLKYSGVGFRVARTMPP